MNSSHTLKYKSYLSSIVLFLIGVVLLSCSNFFNTRKLTKEQKRKDIEYLAQWANSYSPFVELNQTQKDIPDYLILKDYYVDLAEKSKTNTEFIQAVYSYAQLIGASGHFSIHKGSDKNFLSRKNAQYWHKTFYENCILYPPFQVARITRDYTTFTNYKNDTTYIPKGSKILTVNGMSCKAYLEHIKNDTWVKHIKCKTENLDSKLLLINDGEGCLGWNISFLLPNLSTKNCFVPASKGRKTFTRNFEDISKGNCICLTLAYDIGYIRIKSLSPEFIDRDNNTIRTFLEQKKFKKLVIDVRNNSGGSPDYYYDNLLKPFIDKTVSYKYTTGLKKKFLIDYDKKYIKKKQIGISCSSHETSMVETSPPIGFDNSTWVFYELSKSLTSENRYNFDGDIFVLINEKTASAADDFANAIQRTGIATLVGQNTFGSAAGFIAPVPVNLPKSGIEFIFEVDLLINQDGSINEMIGTSPDIKLSKVEVPETVTVKDILNDEWVKTVMSL
ncbi:MAG: S41 family peptidase [Cytophagales bacterium]|nr:S41 family peptidase [Cytophagales bacterium]